MSDTGAERPYTLTDEVRSILNSVSTATIASQLQRKGLRNCFLNGLKPTRPGMRLLGYAHTLRYVALREDLQKTHGGLMNAQRRGVEGISADEVLVIEARGEPHAGTIGDIFTMRVKALGGAGVITDGALRDTPAIKKIDLPVYHQSSHAATLGKLHLPWETQTVITCAGVAVVPGDVLVGDDEGVCVIPAAMVAEIAAASVTMEAEEEWALERVAAGDSSVGTFPIAPERRAEYEAWRAAKG
jgi:5-oxopent-3-ene-1,2,5-tricarboxylate decarboxylase / 2-hydroxyhepta-2,4-diene-1,7-dioate isomerase